MKIENKIKRNILLAPLTTYKIGGPAEYYCEINSGQELKELFVWLKKQKMFYTLLAGGSNLLVNDAGVKGLVIRLNNEQIRVKGARIECGAGSKLNNIVWSASSYNLTGFEWAVGIPGTAGGAVRGNAGSFGSNMAAVVETVNVFDVLKNRFEILSRNDCKFDYRESLFKNNFDLVIWQAVFRLCEGKSSNINKKMDEILSKRRAAFPSLPSAGSVFKNLNIGYIKENNFKLAEKLIKKIVVRDGMVGAKWIISELDLPGKVIGGAKISLEHPNFIVNTGKATAEDVVILISFIKQQVRTKLKLQLLEEIQYFGFK
ncbi:MAG: UDP-N-acetylmuramate dehydrogenase [Patescibacteria group bacterium]|nr:UDP-N-acetylmuramate dehydrogenase [Patescibacteria group bacterium]